MGESMENSTDDFIISLNRECPKELGELIEKSNGDVRRFDDTGFTLSLQNGLENLRLEKSLTDVVLVVGNSSFSCHRVVLAAASNYFRAMFCNDLKEKYEEKIIIQGVEAETMQTILDYTYTSKVVITKQNVQKILEAASLFQTTRRLTGVNEVLYLSSEGYMYRLLDGNLCLLKKTVLLKGYPDWGSSGEPLLGSPEFLTFVLHVSDTGGQWLSSRTPETEWLAHSSLGRMSAKNGDQNGDSLLDPWLNREFLRMVDSCSSFLTEALHPENCVGILRLADAHCLDLLKLQVQSYIIQNFSQVVNHEEFLELTFDILHHILKSDELYVTEEAQVFETVIKWVQYKQSDRISLLPKMLECVRLPLLDPWYLVGTVETNELIRECPDVFNLMQEARMYYLTGNEIISERTKPRIHEFQSEVFMIIGGCTKDEKFVTEVTCLDPLRRSRLEVAKLPMCEQEGESDLKKWVEFACITFKNEVYISGGKETQHEVWKYNSSINKWIQIEYLNVGRWRHKMAALCGKVYALGGFDGSQRIYSVEAYDPFHNCWTEVAPLIISVSSFAAASHKNKLYVIGGGPNGKLATDKTQCYDPSTNKWSLKSPMPVEAKCINAVSFHDHIYVVGGAMKALYSYSPLDDSWTLVTTFSHERASCGIAACCNKIFITGGRDERNEVIATVLCWNIETAKLTEECVLPRGVSHHSSVTIRKSYTHIRRIVAGAVSV